MPENLSIRVWGVCVRSKLDPSPNLEEQIIGFFGRFLDLDPKNGIQKLVGWIYFFRQVRRPVSAGVIYNDSIRPNHLLPYKD